MSDAREYRLKRGEPLPEGIARVARGRIDHAIDELSGAVESTRRRPSTTPART